MAFPDIIKVVAIGGLGGDFGRGDVQRGGILADVGFEQRHLRDKLTVVRFNEVGFGHFGVSQRLIFVFLS